MPCQYPPYNRPDLRKREISQVSKLPYELVDLPLDKAFELLRDNGITNISFSEISVTDVNQMGNEMTSDGHTMLVKTHIERKPGWNSVVIKGYSQ